MVELFLTPRWKTIRWFLLTNINLCQLQCEYFADVSIFSKLISHIFSNRITLKVFVLSHQIFRNAEAIARLHKNKYRFDKSCRHWTFSKNDGICR